MRRILIITGRYLPGYKDGGPVRTIKNLVDNLADDYAFTIMCADRDHGDLKPYDNINVDALNKTDKALVFYSGNGKFKVRDILGLCKSSDLIYICGPYNGYAIKTLMLKRLKLIKKPLVLAPMGSFSKGALAIKSQKKQIFFNLCKTLGLYKDVSFSVTSDVEKRELKDVLGLDNKCYIAEDMPRSISYESGAEKRDNNAKVQNSIVFISRICEKKNLTYAIDILSGIKENVTFHIYGIIEDKEYYDKCIKMLEKLPSNISWKYMGEAESDDVPDIFSRYDMFLFPTMGENFGHVISEALLAGCIPVISDTTPWLDLEDKDCGYVTPLSDRSEFIRKITQICKMTEDEKMRKSENAKRYFMEKREKAVKDSGYKKMFDELILNEK